MGINSYIGHDTEAERYYEEQRDFCNARDPIECTSEQAQGLAKRLLAVPDDPESKALVSQIKEKVKRDESALPMKHVIGKLVDLEIAQDDLLDEVRSTFFVGNVIDYYKNGHVVTGEILQVRLCFGSNMPTLRVRNTSTLKEYTIRITDVVHGDLTLFEHANNVLINLHRFDRG